MINNTTQSKLLHNLFTRLRAHRPAFKQTRPFRRAVGMVLGEIFSFGRHTVTQGQLSLGITDGDWSAGYRLFSRERFDEEKLSACLLQETLERVGVDEPYCAAIDGTSIHRSSLKMPGTSWLRDARFSAFRPGIHRAQRFLHGAWLTPLEAGYSRAIPQGDPCRCASPAGMGGRQCVHPRVAAGVGWCGSSCTEAAGPGRRGL